MFPILLIPLLRQYKSVFNTTASLQDVRVLRTGIAFTADVGAPELEFLRQLRRTGPLDILFIVVGASVGAADRVDAVEATDSLWADALGLWYGRGAARGGLLAGAKGKGCDLGEQDGILGDFRRRRGACGGRSREE